MTDTFDIYMHSIADRDKILENISCALQKPGASILVDRHDFSRLFGYSNFCDGTRGLAEQWFNSLTLQLHFVLSSESMGNHDSGYDEWRYV
ncbi:hypothetical protein, partial [Acetobacter pasteurianus]